MRTFLLQDWTTIRSSLGATFVQDIGGWLDLNGFSDVTCWIDIAEVSPPIRGSLSLQLQTSPTCDDANFVAMAPSLQLGTAAPFVQASSTPTIVRSATGLTTNSLMRYVRWTLTPTTTASWDVTFRIHAIAARSATFVPSVLPGCILWYRADLGVNLGGTSVLNWNDQSGTNDSNKNLTSVNAPTYTLADSNYNNQPTVLFANASSTYMTSTSFVTPVNQPNTWVIVGHIPTLSTVLVALASNDLTSTQQIARNSTLSEITMTANSTTLGASGTWSTPGVVLTEFYGASSALYYNNFTTPTTGSVGTGAGSGLNSLTLGSSDAASGSGDYWDGPIAEIIGYSGILSSASKAQLRNYLRGRYGLAIG